MKVNYKTEEQKKEKIDFKLETNMNREYFIEKKIEKK